MRRFLSWTGPSDGPETGCLVGWVGEGASTLQEEPASWGTIHRTEYREPRLVFLLRPGTGSPATLRSLLFPV